MARQELKSETTTNEAKINALGVMIKCKEVLAAYEETDVSEVVDCLQCFIRSGSVPAAADLWSTTCSLCQAAQSQMELWVQDKARPEYIVNTKLL